MKEQQGPSVAETEHILWIDQLTSFLSTWLLKVGYNPLDEGNVFEILNNSMERNIGLTVNG